MPTFMMRFATLIIWKDFVAVVVFAKKELDTVTVIFMGLCLVFEVANNAFPALVFVSAYNAFYQ